jgi:hypothetical protein
MENVEKECVKGRPKCPNCKKVLKYEQNYIENPYVKTKNVLQKIFDSLKNVPVTMVSYGGSPHNISLLVPADQKVNTLQLLNSGLFGL